MGLAAGEQPLGKSQFWPVWQAAERHNLAVGIHAGSSYHHATTGSGWPSYYLEDYAAQSLAFHTQLGSFIAEGVFVKFPKLKLVLIESGVTWIAPYLWRLSKFWRGVRLEVPWIDRSPVEFVRDHVRLTIQPFDAPNSGETIGRLMDQLPATHNSMSAPGNGWFSSEQERPIGGQLQDGIRGLLFDTHYADKLPNGRVRTYFSSKEDLDLVKNQDGVSEASFEAALRLRERLGFRGEGERGMYLCHTFCELGATPLSEGLDDIHRFLVTHPSEVVVVVNQDYVTPEDFVKAVGAAGLARYAFTPPEGDDWPTLRQMIDDDHRLVLLAENHAGAAPWYQLAYDRLVEETPFHFPSAAVLNSPSARAASCEPNRGPESAPLFLINHWVSTDPVPRPSDAAKVNAYEPLLARARECERIRHHLPNLLAINFYKEGDVFRVVDTLNGV